MRKITIILLLFIELLTLKSVNTRSYAQDIADCQFFINCVDPTEPHCKVGNTPNSYELDSGVVAADFIFNLDKLSPDIWKQGFPSDFFTNTEFYTHLDGNLCKNYSKTDEIKESHKTNITNFSLPPPVTENCYFNSVTNHSSSHTFNLEYNYNNLGWKTLCSASYTVRDYYNINIDITPVDGGYDIDSFWKVIVSAVKIPRGQRINLCTDLDGNNLNFEAGGTQLAERGTLGIYDFIGGGICNFLNEGESYWFVLKNFPKPDKYTINVRMSTPHGEVVQSKSFEVLQKDADTPTPIPPTLAPVCSSPYQCTRGVCNNPALPNTPGYGICQSSEYTCCLLPTPTNPDLCYIEPCTYKEGGRTERDCSTPLCQTSCSFCHPPTPVLSYTPIPALPDLTPLCEQVGTDFQGKCKDCVERDKGMWTAIGCLPTSGLESFLKDYLFTFGVGIAGGIAFLYFLYGSFLFLTSAGNAETVGQAKEIIISAVSGLIFILLSIFFLKIIGADILRIPGFG